MSNLVNGKTPEEIKRGIELAAFECDDQFCDECKFAQDCHTFQAYEVAQNAIALIECMEATLERLGEFGKLFEEYTGCPRGATGRAALPSEEEVLAMKPIRDVDNGEWIPVNADALRELVAKYKQLRDAVPVVHARWIYSGDMDLDGNSQGYCSRCGAGDKHRADLKNFVPYCWKCGARMDEKEDTNGHQTD